MAGFLAPEIKDIGSATGGVSTVADTSLGTALSNVSSILNTGFKSGATTAPRATQQDRDNETLRPFSRKIARLQSLRSKIGEFKFNAELTTQFVSFVTNNPVLTDDAKKSVLAISGVELGGEQFNILDVQADINSAYLETPRGRANSFSIINRARDPETGKVDNKLAFALVSQAAAQASADEAELDALQFQQKKEEAIGAINEERLRGVVDNQLAKFGAQARDSVAGIMNIAIQSDARLEDATVLLAEIRQRKALLKSQIEADARRGGFANHPDFDVNIALAPYDNVISLITDLGDDVIKAFNVLQAQSNADSIRFANNLTGGVFGGNKDVQNYIVQTFLVPESADISQAIAATDFSAMRENARGAPLFLGTATPVAKDSPPTPASVAINNEIVDTARTLTPPERKREVKVNLATFGSYTPAHAGNENFRATAVEGFTLATVSINTSREPLAEGTFDKIYDAHFFGAYDNIVSFGDTTAANLQTAVTTNLSTVFEQRMGLVNTRLSNFSNDNFPDINLRFDSGEVVVDLGQPLNPNTRFLFESLDRANLPKTLEGARDLAILEPNNPAFLAFSEASGVTFIINEVDYINKIIGTINKLDDLRPHIIPRIEERINGAGPVVPDLISTGEEYEALPMGTVYNYVREDGSIGTDTKGEENR